jgi:2-polyprenyl-3-methyl-5-hydroxy-6-metoxy-1,4-benzoquinol methylase
MKMILVEILLRRVLALHSWTYKWSGRLAVKLGAGIHPKHGIIEYEKWFTGHIQPDWVVVDIGCNTGTMVREMAKKASFVYGIELNRSLIDAAKRKSNPANVEYHHADATAFDYSSLKPIHCVTLSNVLEHIEKRPELISDLIKAVNWRDPSDKTFLIRVPMIERDWISVYKKNIGLEYRLDDTHFIEYTAKGLAQELEQAGLRIVANHVTFGEAYIVAKAK